MFLKKCYIKPLCWLTAGIAFLIAVFWQPILAGVNTGVTLVANVVFWLFIAGCAATAAAVVVSFVRMHRDRQAERGACLDCSQNCNGEQNATAPIPVHTLRLRDQGERDVPAVPELDAPNVYQMAAWQKRKQAEAVGRKSPPASS